MSFNESFGLKVRFLLQALIYKGGNILDSRLHALCAGTAGSTPVPSTNL
nr:MAG TPA: hypothetical protein [Caudoviricetes sp.]